MINLASAPISGTPAPGSGGSGSTVALLRSIARHGMTKGAAFCYAVVVGAAANFVIDYLHHHEDAIPIVAHDTAPAVAGHERAATAPIVRPEPHIAEPRVPERPTTAALPPVPEVKPLPAPATPVVLPQVPTLPLPSAAATLPSPSDLPTPALKPAAVPSLPVPTAAASAEPSADRPAFSVPPATPAAASAVPPADKDKPVEAMSIPAPPSPGASIGSPVSLLPPPDKPADPPQPKAVKPGSGTGGLY